VVTCPFYSTAPQDIEDLPSTVLPAGIPVALHCPCIHGELPDVVESGGYRTTAGRLDTCGLCAASVAVVNGTAPSVDVAQLSSDLTLSQAVCYAYSLLRSSCPLLNRLKADITDVRKLMHESHGEEPGAPAFAAWGSPNSSWTKVCERNKVITYYRHVEGSDTHDIMLEGIIENPPINVASLMNEATLYEKWVPFTTSSQCTKQLSMFRKTVLVKFSLPWPLSKREVIAYGIGIDRLENGVVYIICHSIDVSEQLYNNISCI